MRCLSIRFLGLELLAALQPDAMRFAFVRESGEITVDLPWLRIFLTNHRHRRWAR